MAPNTKTEADHIYLLLAIMEHTDGKINWDEVAKTTGLYKRGKFVNQAYKAVKDKYGNGPPPNGTPNTSSVKKNVTQALSKRKIEVADDGGEEGTPSKKGKKEPVFKADDDELGEDENQI